MSSHLPLTDSDVVDGLSVRYLKIFGIWRAINHYRTTGKKNSFIKYQTTAVLLLLLPYITFQCLSYFVTKVDFGKVTFLTIQLLPSLQLSFKVLVFWLPMDSQCRLFDLMRNDFLKSIPEYKRSEARLIQKRASKLINLLCMASFVVNSSIIILYTADPGISVDYIAHHTGSMLAVTGGKKKILGGWYPLPMSESPYYEAVFIYEAIIMAYGGLLLAVYDCLFYQVLMCLYIKFMVLGYHVSTLQFDTDNPVKKQNSIHDKTDSSLYEELYLIIRDHKKLLSVPNVFSYSDKLRKVYNPLVTMVLGMGVFILIISVFQFLFVGRGSPMFIFKSVQYFAYQAVEVAMFCFGSSYIEAASSDLQFAIYSSDWYKADTKFRKAAQMMMVRAKKGVTLTAIKMYPIKRETIMSILQFTYTVAALMSRMKE